MTTATTNVKHDEREDTSPHLRDAFEHVGRQVDARRLQPLAAPSAGRPVARKRPMTLPSCVMPDLLEQEDLLHRDDRRLPCR